MIEQHSSKQKLDISPNQSRQEFRYYTRLVRTLPNNSYYHQKRLKAACQFNQGEPLQGALADYFFACWYDTAKQGYSVLDEFAGFLPNHVVQEFLQYINKGHHLSAISPLATRWSVLVSPSMNVPKHKLYISKDDAKLLAQQVSRALLDAEQNNNPELITELEEQYLNHCQACQDRMGFMMTYFALAKEGWEFSQAWNDYKHLLETTATQQNQKD